MKTRWKELIADNNTLIILLVIAVLAVSFIPGFSRNISSVILESGVYGMIAVGLAIVMLTGNIDLSVGFQAGLASVTTLLVLNATGRMAAAGACAVLVGALMGAVNGVIVTRMRINPLITTIATCYIFKGLCFAYTKDGSIRPATELKSSLTALYKTTLGFESLSVMVVLVLALMILLYFIMKKTPYGRSLYAVGDNAEAANLNGINTRRVVLIAYILCGICCALAGLFMASRASGAVYTQGAGKEVFAVSVCIIGGVKMTGGRGTMVSVLTGLLIMRIISTVMNCLFVPAAWVDFVSGLLLILVLFFDKLTQSKKAL